MSWYNKVIWSEGMFLRPVHFQQHNRYVENLVETRCRAISNHGWGFSELKLDRSLLALGKVAISEARGLFPDGTPFDIPNADDAPVPLEVPEDARDMIVYLALPVRRAGMDEIGDTVLSEGLERFVRGEAQACEDLDGRALEIGDQHAGEVAKTATLGGIDQVIDQ